MSLSESVDGIISEMVALKQVLRRTAPAHRLTDADRERVGEAIARCEDLLKRIKEEAGVQLP
ncbi:MAG: hypothetical protein ABC585_01700 [Candidatus Methanosuratincola petrocarbonis]|nr:hypothetical protein [Candidatus Methanosuratincola sp.]